MENNETKQPQGKTYDGGVTEEQINKWKAVHKRVIRIDVYVFCESWHFGGRG